MRGAVIMNEHVAGGRQFYSPTGRIAPVGFAIAALLLLAATSGAAYAMYFTFARGWYFTLIESMLVELLLAGLLLLAIDATRCRNRWIATILGLAMGVLLMGGFFFLDMRARQPERARLSDLPGFIATRARSLDTKDIRLRGPTPLDNHNHGIDLALGWAPIVAEIAFCLGVFVYVGWSRASRPFCESCGRWMRQRMRCYPYDAFDDLRDMARTGNLDELEFIPPVIQQLGAGCAIVTLSRCPGPVSGPVLDPCQSYVSILRPRYGPNHAGRSQNTIFAAIREMAIPHALAERIAPLFADSPATTPGPTPDAHESAPLKSNVKPTNRESECDADDDITIETLAPTGIATAGAHLLATVPYLIGVAGLGVLMLSVYLADPSVCPNVSDTLGMLLVPFGFVCAGLGLVAIWIGGTWPRECRLQRRLLERIEERSADPRRQSGLFVRWASTDAPHGFRTTDFNEYAMVSSYDGHVIIEGDVRRLRVPGWRITHAREDAMMEFDHVTRGFGVQNQVLIFSVFNGSRKVDIAMIALGPPWRKTQRAISRRHEALVDLIQSSAGLT